MCPIINLFGREVGVYSLWCIFGIFICCIVAFNFGKKYKIMYEDIILLAVSMCIGALIGGHFLYGITQLGNIIDFLKNNDITQKNIINLFNNFLGGSVFYGGLFGAIAALKIHTHFSNTLNTTQALDVFAVVAPLFHFFGRIGCFFGGCCYGIESSIGFVITGNSLIPEVNNVARFPVQLLEAVLNVGIFIVIFIFFKNNIFNGRLIKWYLLLYSAVRMRTEFLRGDTIRGHFLFLSTSQWISASVLIVVLIGFMYDYRKYNCESVF